jgi:hypothetical protein
MMWCWYAVCAAGGAWSEDLTGARACVRIADNTARLACFDAAFAPAAVPPSAPSLPASAQVTGSAPVPASAPAAGPAAPVAPTVPTPAQPAARFGDNGQLPSDLKAKAGLPKKLDLKVVTAAPFGRGLYRLTLDNSQIWETRQADWALAFKSGDMVTISRMTFGGYQLSLAGQGRSVGVNRIQ